MPSLQFLHIQAPLTRTANALASQASNVDGATGLLATASPRDSPSPHYSEAPAPRFSDILFDRAHRIKGIKSGDSHRTCSAHGAEKTISPQSLLDEIVRDIPDEILKTTLHASAGQTTVIPGQPPIEDQGEKAPTTPAIGRTDDRLVEQLAFFLDRFPQVTETIESGSGEETDTGNLVLDSKKSSAQLQRMIHGLTVLLHRAQATSGGTTAGVEGQQPSGIPLALQTALASGESSQPDLIYLAAAQTPGQKPQGRPHLLVADFRQEGRSPVEVLEQLIHQVQETLRSSKTERDTSSDSATDLPDSGLVLAPELGSGSVSGTTEISDLREANPSPMIDSVRQVQAALADMLERMRGEVRFEPESMRAVIHLDPPSLGRVHIQIQIDGQRLQADVSADDSSAQDFLRQHQSDLQESFQGSENAFETIEVRFSEKEEDFEPLLQTAEIS